jgi:protein-S-isoprenylcysteine O-methyltransferase Ste14
MQTLKLGFQFALTLGIPLLYLLSLAISFQKFEFIPSPLSILGTVVAALGVAFWILSMISLGSSFGVLPQKQKKVKRGLYKYFNHPMYIGISATIIGLSIANKSFEGLVFYCVVMLPILLIRARLEDKNLF